MFTDLSLQRKFLFVGAALVLPLVVVLWLLIGQMNIAIQFAEQEIVGTEQLRPLQQGLYASLRWRSGDAVAAADIESAFKKLDTDTVKNALKAETQWRELSSSLATKNVDDVVAKLRATIARFGDTSNLILDPDLDSYYVMDSVLLKLPNSIDLLGQLDAFVIAVQQRGSLTAEEYTQLVVWSGLLRSDRDGVNYDIGVAFENNHAGDIDKNLKNLAQNYDSQLEKMLGHVAQHFTVSSVNTDRASWQVLVTAVADANRALYDAASNNLQQMLQRRADGLTNEKWWVLVIVIALEIAALFFVWITLRAVVHRLGGEPDYAQHIVREIAQGDLAVRVDLNGAKPDSLLASLAMMQTTLRDMFNGIRENADRVLHASDELLRTVESVVSRSQKQADAANTMSAAIHESATSVQQVATHAQQAMTVSQQSSELAATGEHAVQQVAGAIRHLSTQVSESAHTIEELGRNSAQIQSVVQVIRGIADQTNLLALNAAIEAARAGDQGRGFAVVADEVRQLATRTSQSTQEIAQMVEAIQRGTESVVRSMESLSNGAGNSVTQVDSVMAQMSNIRSSTGNARHANDEISSALQQQAQANALLSQHVESVAQSARDSGQQIENTARTIAQVRQLAEDLHGQIAKFRF